MANYHLHAQIIKRSEGRSAVASAAYRRAARMYDERAEKSCNYERKENVIHSEIMIPKGSPEWVKSLHELAQTEPVLAAEKLWNQVEVSANRKDSQLAREVEFSLPIELTAEQSIKLAGEFIQDQFVLRGMIADWSVHWDKGNPHVHAMLTMSSLEQDGFGKRVLEWNSKVILREWRMQWAEYANFHLALHGHDVRIDHRSYKDRGIDLVPSLHLGKAICDMDRRGLFTEMMVEANQIRKENLQRILNNPEVLFKKLLCQSATFTPEQVGQALGSYVNDQGRFSVSDEQHGAGDIITPADISDIFKKIEYHDSVFGEKEIAKAVLPCTDNAEHFAKAMVAIKSSAELLPLGPGEDGRERYTTKKMFSLENEIQDFADKLRKTRQHVISEKRVNAVLAQHEQKLKKTLTQEQQVAVRHVLKPGSIACVIGRAGTGKSFLLGAAKAIWDSQGRRVHGIALSGIAADGLSKDAGIQARTIESFRYAIANGRIVLQASDVVVMDEAGMTDSVAMHAVLKTVQEAKAKLVLVGDPAQLQPVGPGASFRAITERVGFVELQTVYRQEAEWQRESTVNFSKGETATALNQYEERGCVHLLHDANQAQTKLVQEWFAARAESQKNLNEYLVLAHRNDDVNELNARIRVERIAREEITQGHNFQSSRGVIQLSKEDRILFLKNDHHLGVSNGRFATVKSVSLSEAGKIQGFVAVLDGTQKEVIINPNQFSHFTYGYAATVHKTQGVTVDNAFVYAGGKGWNRHLAYVAMTRHRKGCHLYGDTTTHVDKQGLFRSLGRYGIKDSLLDFPIAFAERRGIDTDKWREGLVQHLAQRLEQVKDRLKQAYDALLNPEQAKTLKAQNLNQEQEQEAKQNKTQQRRQYAKQVADYVDANREVGKTWQALKEHAKILGIEEFSFKAEVRSLIVGSPQLNAFEKAKQQRNMFASAISAEPSKYKQAIAIHGIDNAKLEKQARHFNKTQETQFKQEAHLPQQKIEPTESLHDLLKKYVVMELEQTRLVNKMHLTRATNQKSGKELAAIAIAHSNKINEFAVRISKSADFKTELEKFKNGAYVTVAQRGGFQAINERIRAGEHQPEDIKVLLVQLRGKASYAQQQSRSQDQHRSFGY